MRGILLRSGDKLAFLAIGQGSLVYGRSDLKTLGADNTVSREQFTLTLTEGQVLLVDGNAITNTRSLNGSWVNGQKVAYSQLHSGDQVEVGNLTFVVMGGVVDF